MDSLSATQVESVSNPPRVPASLHALHAGVRFDTPFHEWSSSLRDRFSSSVYREDLHRGLATAKGAFQINLILRIDLLAPRWWFSLCSFPCLSTASLFRAGPTMCLWPPASVSICVGRQAFCVHGKMRAKACVF